MSTPQEQYLRAKCEVEASLASASALCEQWQAALNDNPRNLSKKDIDQLAKQFKNKLLTVKWDCEDLEEIVNISEYDVNKTDPTNISACRDFIRDSRMEITQLMEKLGEGDTKTKLFSKHGITFSNPSQAAASLLLSAQNNNCAAKYERLTTNDTDIVEFDIANTTNANQPSTASTQNHHHHQQQQADKITTQSQSSRDYNHTQTMNIHVNPNDSQLMLDMLETEFYNPQPMPNTSRLDFALRKFLESADRTKIVGTIAFMFSIPILLLIFIM